MTENENTAYRIQVYNYRIVIFGLHWWAFQQRSCRKIRDWWKVSELSTIPAIYTSCHLISNGRALLGRFACVEAANGRIRRQPFSLSFSYGRHLSFPTCGHWELRSLWLMLLSMRHDPLYPYEASLKQFTSFFQLGLYSVYVRCHMAPWDLIATFVQYGVQVTRATNISALAQPLLAGTQNIQISVITGFAKIYGRIFYLQLTYSAINQFCQLVMSTSLLIH